MVVSSGISITGIVQIRISGGDIYTQTAVSTTVIDGVATYRIAYASCGGDTYTIEEAGLNVGNDIALSGTDTTDGCVTCSVIKINGVV